MVTPDRPRRTVVKANRAPRKKPDRKHRCVICSAELRGGHAIGDLVCDCHPSHGGDPRLAPPTTMALTPEERLLVMLYRAAPEPLNVHRAFGCPSTDTNMAWFRDAVSRINSRLGPVRGHLHVGYKFASVRSWGGAKVKA